MPKRPEGTITPNIHELAPPSRPLDRPETPVTLPAGGSRPAKPVKADGVVKKSYTLSPDHVAYLDMLALEQGAKRGKSMNASEALRLVLDAHMKRAGGKS